MRTIKFRAWHEPSKEMFKWGHIGLVGMNNTIVHITERVFTIEKTDDNSVDLMQFTGLQDSKGDDIYEGDILGLNYFYDKDAIAIVEFNNGCFHPKGYPGHAIDERVEIIGNIHENPELL